MDGLLDFSFNVHRLLVKNLDPFPSQVADAVCV